MVVHVLYIVWYAPFFNIFVEYAGFDVLSNF